MTSQLRLSLIILSAVFMIVVIRLVRRGRLQLKYSLLWLLIGCTFIICAVFPGVVTFFKGLFGIALTSNFVFLAGLGGLFLVCLSLTVIVSWQARDIRMLVQRIALLEHDLGVDEADARRRSEPNRK